MDKAVQNKIFEPFFTTKERSRGTGLGLASAYGIIKNHDGIINVYSERGKGTTFTIYLPATATTEIAGEKSYMLPLRGTETVLLVDDEDIILEVGCELLEELGKIVEWRSYDHNHHGFAFIQRNPDGIYDPDSIQREVVAESIAWFDRFLKHADVHSPVLEYSETAGGDWVYD